MSSYFWLVVLPNFDKLLSMIGMLGLVGCAVASIPAALSYQDAWGDKQKSGAIQLLKILARSSSCCMACLFISCFIPSKQEIIQLKVISVVSELNGVDQIPQKLVDKLNAALDGDKND